MENDCCCEREISIGAWGSPSDKEWSYKAKRGIKQIIIKHGGIIDSILFVDDSGDADSSIKFGGNGGNRIVKIDIDFPSEFLTGISGTYGQNTYGYNICSLKFQTNKNQYGPFGTESCTPFSFHTKDGVITGFHGRAGQYLVAIGVYVKPICSFSTECGMKQQAKILHCRLPLSAGPWGSINSGKVWDDGVFSAVKLVYIHQRSTVITGIQFGYEKRDGTAFRSPMHGSNAVDTVRKIEIDGTSEFLIAIEGFHGPVEGIAGMNVITSLTFHTNKGKYGPMGTEIGTYFTSMTSSMSTNGKIVGFHGRSGAYLDAIGVHTEYF